MRVGMAMVGSRGDIQPFVALAHALVREGHEVTATANAGAAGLVAGAGASFVPIGMDVHALLSSQKGQRLLGSGKTRKFLDFANQTLTAEVMRQLSREDVRQRATAPGDELRREDGIARAMDTIIQFAGPR